MSNVVDLVTRQPVLPIDGKMTLIVPHSETSPEFELRLYHAMTALFRVCDVKIVAINFPNERGEQIMMYNIDITDRHRPQRTCLDEMMEFS